MAARVQPSEVKQLVETDRPDGEVEANMIETANAIVDEYLTTKKLSKRILHQIELYLAAHFLALAEERGGLLKSNYGRAEEWLDDVYSQGFNLTRFGQQAIVLDTSGTLAQIGGGTKLKAQFRVV